MSESLLGTCYAMCPERERYLREKEGPLHFLEIDESTRDLRRPKADPAKMVKCYSRPAADKAMTDVSELRPGPVLLLTLRYLLKNVVTRSDVDWATIYDFVFDRLRAIRQDMVIQRIDVHMSIQLYEPIVRFYVYSAERMCERSLREYVPKFNNEHLLKCIKQLLVLYDKRDARDVDDDGICESVEELNVSDNRSQFEALYILLYLGDATALTRALSLPAKYRESVQVRAAMKISLAWHLKNYVRACRLIGRLSPLLACAALSNLPSIKRNALQIMSHGYNSQSLTYPGLRLQEILLYLDICKIRKDCELFGLTVTNDNVHFQKSKLNSNELLANPEMHFLDNVLHSLLPDILFR